MKCPIDGTDLVMADRQGIEIDYCPKCRGVWLDRGELDKIIERSAAAMTPAAPPVQPQQPPPVAPRRDDNYRLEGSYRYDDDDYKRKKRKSILDDIFDF